MRLGCTSASQSRVTQIGFCQSFFYFWEGIDRFFFTNKISHATLILRILTSFCQKPSHIFDSHVKSKSTILFFLREGWESEWNNKTKEKQINHPAFSNFLTVTSKVISIRVEINSIRLLRVERQQIDQF